MATSAESKAVDLNTTHDTLDRAGLGAKTEVSVELKSYEQLLGDLTGVATISRAEHRAQQGRPLPLRARADLISFCACWRSSPTTAVS